MSHRPPGKNKHRRQGKKLSRESRLKIAREQGWTEVDHVPNEMLEEEKDNLIETYRKRGTMYYAEGDE